MPDTPPQSASSSSGEHGAEVDTGAPKAPASGESPPLPPTPKVDVEPRPVPDAGASPTQEAYGPWSFCIGEVLDVGARGCFLVKDRLGRGGFGEVYRAEYIAPLMPEPVHVFALKVLRLDADLHEHRTFTKEVRILSLLRHERIARYHTSFEHEGRLVLVMEYVEGRSLYSVLRLAWSKGRFLSASSSLELVAQVAEALDYAHQAKDEQGNPLHIVHRDISPANILITETGLAKVVDFGVAQADLEPNQTFTDARFIKGKVPYLSPEQVEGKPLDGRSDLFSLACVLVEMLTGQPPFGRAVHAATLRAITSVTPEEVDRATRGLSEKVRAVCQKALARDPADRFATGREMAQALRALHEDRGPPAVREEIAALEALPDMSRDALKAMYADLRRMKRIRRTAKRVAALVFATVAAYSVWIAYRPTPKAPPAQPPAAAVHNEPPMSPLPEQGTSTVKNEMKSQPAPAVDKAAPAALNPDAGTTKRAKALACAMLATGCVHIQTGTPAGDCTISHRPPDLKGQSFIVTLDESNPKGPCTGPLSRPGVALPQPPCPAFQGPIVLKVVGNPGDYPMSRPCFGCKTILLKGEAKFVDAKGKGVVWEYTPEGRVYYKESEVTRYMTALITEMQMPDGNTVPVCGVLFGSDYWPELQRPRTVGVPVITINGKPQTDFMKPVVRFYGPSP